MAQSLEREAMRISVRLHGDCDPSAFKEAVSRGVHVGADGRARGAESAVGRGFLLSVTPGGNPSLNQV